jgi:D-alanyl-D-alanine carboxypeptidase
MHLYTALFGVNGYKNGYTAVSSFSFLGVSTYKNAPIYSVVNIGTTNYQLV